MSLYRLIYSSYGKPNVGYHDLKETTSMANATLHYQFLLCHLSPVTYHLSPIPCYISYGSEQTNKKR